MLNLSRVSLGTQTARPEGAPTLSHSAASPLPHPHLMLLSPSLPLSDSLLPGSPSPKFHIAFLDMSVQGGTKPGVQGPLAQSQTGRHIGCIAGPTLH